MGKCSREELRISLKNAKIQHAIRLGIIIGACTLFASKLWCQEETAKIKNEDEKNVEIKIEKVHQHESSGRALVVCATMDKEEEISKKLINMLNDNELG